MDDTFLEFFSHDKNVLLVMLLSCNHMVSSKSYINGILKTFAIKYSNNGSPNGVISR
jgi:hypothetical protein